MLQISQTAIITALILLVPMLLIWSNRENWLLAWICFTCGLNIFDPIFFINMPAARIAGLLLIPKMFSSSPRIIRSKAAIAIIAKYGLLVILGVLWGVLFPWENDRVIREFNQLPLGRTIIYLIRTLGDVSLTFFVAQQVMRRRDPLQILNYVLIGTSVSAVAGILEFLTRVDFYQVVTGQVQIYSPYETLSRVRGFSYEPRGFGLFSVYGIFFSIILWELKRSGAKLKLVINAIGFFLASSTSAIFAMASATVGLVLYYKRAHANLIKTCCVALLFLGCLFTYQFAISDYFFESLEERLSGKRFDEPQNFIESITFRMEIFDSAALLFLLDNPIYFAAGTGPGLISLPATAYLPKSNYYDWIVDVGVNAQPTMGLLSEVSNTGVIGLLLWLLICFYSIRAFSLLARYYPNEKEIWLATRAAFVVGMSIFAIQSSPFSAITPVLMGLGVGADCLAQVDRSRHRQTSMQLDHLAPSPADSV